MHGCDEAYARLLAARRDMDIEKRAAFVDNQARDEKRTRITRRLPKFY